MPLHPETQAFLDMLAENNPPPWSEMSPPEGRELFSSLRELFGDAPSVERVTDYEVSGRFKIRVYCPAEGPTPVLLYFHGGGWVLGDIDTHDPLCRSLSKQSGVAVVSIDYRRPPEHRYPAALEDGMAALEFVCSQADELGVDASRLAVAGDSAGGNLALGVALRARDAGGPPIAYQVLIYPVVEPNFDSESYRQYADGFGLTRESMMWFWHQHVGAELQYLDQYAAALRAASLAGMPPTHIVTAEYDVLRSEGEALADLLEHAGVPTTRQRYDGMIHGFVHFNAAFEIGRQAISEIAARIAQRLA